MKQSEKYGEEMKNRRERKYLDMILEGKLKNPPLSVIKEISDALGVNLQQEDACK